MLLGAGLAGCSNGTTADPSLAPVTEDAPTLTPEALSVTFTDPRDVAILALQENGYSHLFAYIPHEMPLLRLTAGAWNDTSPALSPDGKRLAFASNRSGYWDIYLLDLQRGETIQLTDTPAYDSAPSWSPDGAWLAIETYNGESLEIGLLSLAEPAEPPILLTEHSAADHSPAWAPSGRRIAFVSTRSGDSEIWLADLDRTGDERFVNLSRTPQAAESHPVWTSDGKRLAWASASQGVGFSGIYVWEAALPDRPARWIGGGDWPAWDARGERLITALTAPTQQYLTAYTLDGGLLLPPTPLPGTLRGLIWPSLALPDPLPESYARAAAQTPTPLWSPRVIPLEAGPARWALVPLSDVRAPYPQLHDLVDEGFAALRERVIAEAGWDALANLGNAYVPLTTPLDPGLGQDWLYTGRAFALNPLMANAGWLVAVRQDIGGQTYWRLYLRAQAQDGSQGESLHDPPWDLSARYGLDPAAYEQGGTYAPVAPGYWIDFTALAAQYGWQRLPALPNWRTYYAGTRFTEFVNTGGLDWYAAMLEIYPPEVLVTPTRVLPPTATPTRTPLPTSTRAPTRTPRPTVTPSVTLTPSITPTPIPTNTPLP